MRTEHLHQTINNNPFLVICVFLSSAQGIPFYFAKLKCWSPVQFWFLQENKTNKIIAWSQCRQPVSDTARFNTPETMQSQYSFPPNLLHVVVTGVNREKIIDIVPS